MKVLIIGLGSIGRKHASIIRKLIPDVSIYALRSDRASRSCPGVNNIYSYTDISLINPDFIVIANPTAKHMQTIEKLIKYKLPLFIEKPIHSELSIRSLTDTIKRDGIQTYVACNLRFLDSIDFLKFKLTDLKDTKLNEVNVYCGTFLPDWHPQTDYHKGYSAIPELGGGVHLDMIHELDYLYYLFGSPSNVQRYYNNRSSLSIRAIDYAHYLLDYGDFCANVVMNYYRRDSKRSIELVFSTETWNVDLLNNKINSKNKIIFSSEQRIPDTYESQMIYYLGCLKENKNSFNTITDAIKVLEIGLPHDFKK